MTRVVDVVARVVRFAVAACVGGLLAGVLVCVGLLAAEVVFT